MDMEIKTIRDRSEPSVTPFFVGVRGRVPVFWKQFMKSIARRVMRRSRFGLTLPPPQTTLLWFDTLSTESVGHGSVCRWVAPGDHRGIRTSMAQETGPAPKPPTPILARHRPRKSKLLSLQTTPSPQTPDPHPRPPPPPKIKTPITSN